VYKTSPTNKQIEYATVQNQKGHNYAPFKLKPLNQYYEEINGNSF